MCYGIFHINMIQSCFLFIFLGLFQFKTVVWDLIKYRILDIICIYSCKLDLLLPSWVYECQKDSAFQEHHNELNMKSNSGGKKNPHQRWSMFSINLFRWFSYEHQNCIMTCRPDSHAQLYEVNQEQMNCEKHYFHWESK